ncbi:hypothetical protein D3C78_1011780 [compost metagenome]
MHQGIGNADADDRADQGVRGGCRQAQPPGAEVPQNRRNQQGEDHRKPGRGAGLQNQLHRQQGDDAEGHGAAGQQHPEEVEEARPDHCELWRQRVGVDHCCHGVGGVVETVDELKAQGNQQRHAQQQERGPGGHRGADSIDVMHQAVGREQQPHGQHGKEHHDGQYAGFFVDVGADAACRGGGGGSREGSSHCRTILWRGGVFVMIGAKHCANAAVGQCFGCLQIR